MPDIKTPKTLGISNKVWLSFILATSMFLQRCELDISKDGIVFRLRPLPLWVLAVGTAAITGVLTLEQKQVASIFSDAAHSAIDKFIGSHDEQD